MLIADDSGDETGPDALWSSEVFKAADSQEARDAELAFVGSMR
jgi:hypothetical protein